MKKIINFFYFFIFSTVTISATPPKLTIVFIVDGVGHHVIQKLKPFFNGGLKELLDKGIVYENAYYPHARPATGTGHTALATGAFTDMHGIIANIWFKPDATKVDSVQDNNNTRYEFNAAHEENKHGKSAENVMVEGISDQLMLNSQPQCPYLVYSLSFKDRAAIPLAGKLGKAIWFNYYSGEFTSSKAYFDTLPEWVKQLNKTLVIQKKKWVRWKQAFSPWHQAYNFPYINDYRYAASHRLVGTRIPKRSTTLTPKEHKLFTVSPSGQNMLFNCAQYCLDHLLQTHPNHSLLLWISISCPDKIGHWFGPDSLEYIDLLYHLDQQLGTFMSYVKKQVDPRNTLFVFTADHGSTPIVEILQEQGITNARRINSIQLVEQINNTLSCMFNLKKNIIRAIQLPEVYCDEFYLTTLPSEIKHKIIKTIKSELLKQPGILHIWTREERNAICETFPSLLTYYKHQSYPGRDGLFTIQVQPYTYLAKYPTGTGHSTPYEYDTHVPFIIYQQGTFEKKHVFEKIWALQLAPTLASLCNIPKPSGATFDILPEIKKGS